MKSRTISLFVGPFPLFLAQVTTIAGSGPMAYRPGPGLCVQVAAPGTRYGDCQRKMERLVQIDEAKFNDDDDDDDHHHADDDDDVDDVVDDDDGGGDGDGDEHDDEHEDEDEDKDDVEEEEE